MDVLFAEKVWNWDMGYYGLLIFLKLINNCLLDYLLLVDYISENAVINERGLGYNVYIQIQRGYCFICFLLHCWIKLSFFAYLDLKRVINQEKEHVDEYK